jgi:Nitrate reductase alpha subunit
MSNFNRNSIELVEEVFVSGAKDEVVVVQYIVGQMKFGAIDVVYVDLDNLVNWSRNLFVWCSNLIGILAKGYEYFLKYLLGAQNGVL